MFAVYEVCQYAAGVKTPLACLEWQVETTWRSDIARSDGTSAGLDLIFVRLACAYETHQ